MSKRKVVAFDLETIADKSVIPILPEIKPKANLKDQVKIDADIEEKKKKQIKDLGLNPMMNIICCAGWHGEDDHGHIMLEDEYSEKQLLEAFWDVLGRYDHFVTYNGRAFDMRCLLLHGMQYGIRPSVNIDKYKYNRGNHTDLRLVLAGDEPFAKGKLDFFAKKYLGTGKTEGIDGELVQAYWEFGQYEDIGKYCEQDCELTFDLFEMAQTAGMLE